MNIQLLTLLEVYFLKPVYTNNFFKALTTVEQVKLLKIILSQVLPTQS